MADSFVFFLFTLNGDVSNPRFLPGELLNINPKSM